MSAVREGVRQVMAWLHGWTGLLLGWVLFIMCFAGTLSVFKPEIGRWMRPETTVRAADSATAIANAASWLTQHAPNAPAWYLLAPDPRMNTVDATFAGDDGYVLRALDPLTGAPVPRETSGGEFFYRLHFQLELPHPWGRWLASLAAITMLVALVTGIIAHKKIFKDLFTFRPAKGQRSWLDGHNALGVLALPFHLMITFSGVLTLSSLNMPWGVTSAYGEQSAALYEELSPGGVNRTASGSKAPLAPILPMLREAERRFAGGTIGRVYVLNPGDSAAVVSVFRSDADAIGHAGEISFDGATGRVLADWTENRPAVQAYNIVYALHMGRFAPSVTRWLYFLGGAMLTLAIGTGLILWTVKRREKLPLSISNSALERLNIAVVAGVPLAGVAYLIANRLLPLGMAGRYETEVSAALWTAAAALIAGAALPPRHAWPSLLGLLALACLLAPLLGGPSALLSADPAILGGNLLLLASAASFAALTARHIKRLRAPAPRRRATRQPA